MHRGRNADSVSTSSAHHQLSAVSLINRPSFTIVAPAEKTVIPVSSESYKFSRLRDYRLGD
jgi:hypothetical protein